MLVVFCFFFTFYLQNCCNEVVACFGQWYSAWVIINGPFISGFSAYFLTGNCFLMPFPIIFSENWKYLKVNNCKTTVYSSVQSLHIDKNHTFKILQIVNMTYLNIVFWDQRWSIYVTWKRLFCNYVDTDSYKNSCLYWYTVIDLCYSKWFLWG